MRKRVSLHVRTAKTRSACASVQSDFGLHCPSMHKMLIILHITVDSRYLDLAYLE